MTNSGSNRSDPVPPLAEEARYLHESLFSTHALLDDKTLQRYEAAHRLLFPDERRTVVARIMSKRLDVEAVEFALRRRRLCPELTRKLQILSYLVEIQGPYQDDFVVAKRCPVRAALTLLWQIPSTGWKFLKGECLVRLYGLNERGLL